LGILGEEHLRKRNSLFDFVASLRIWGIEESLLSFMGMMKEN
jgi:hypothetical protein